jgi:PEP-CTERM motif
MVAALFGTSGRASQYRFTTLADTAGGYSSAGGEINNRGQVVYHAFLPDGNEVINLTDGNTTVTLADTIHDFPGDYLGFVTINDSGVVAFSTTPKNGGTSTLWRLNGPLSRGGTLTAISDTSTGPVYFFDSYRINNAGTVAFEGGPKFGAGSAIYTGDGTNVQTVLPPNIELADSLDENSSGTVAFKVRDFQSNQSIRVGDGFSGRVLYQDTNGSDNLGGPSINSLGAIVFSSYSPIATNRHIYLSNGNTVTSLADCLGSFNTFDYSPAINDNGEVVFEASLKAGGSGIFLGVGPVYDTVVASGDPLDGSTVSFNSTFPLPLDVGARGLNNAGQILFGATLANGDNGLFLATPVPEPSSLALGGLAVGVALVRLRLCKKRGSR